MSAIRLRVTFDPALMPVNRWCAHVYKDDIPTGVHAYGPDRGEAISEAQRLWRDYLEAGGPSEEWIDLP